MRSRMCTGCSADYEFINKNPTNDVLITLMIRIFKRTPNLWFSFRLYDIYLSFILVLFTFSLSIFKPILNLLCLGCFVHFFSLLFFERTHWSINSSWFSLLRFFYRFKSKHIKLQLFLAPIITFWIERIILRNMFVLFSSDPIAFCFGAFFFVRCWWSNLDEQHKTPTTMRNRKRYFNGASISLFLFHFSQCKRSTFVHYNYVELHSQQRERGEKKVFLQFCFIHEEVRVRFPLPFVGTVFLKNFFCFVRTTLHK